MSKKNVESIAFGSILWILIYSTGLTFLGYGIVAVYSGEYTAERIINRYESSEYKGSMRTRRGKRYVYIIVSLLGNRGLMGLIILLFVICLYNVILAIVNWRRFLKRKRLYKAGLVPDKSFEGWDWKELLRDVKALLFPKAKKALSAPASDEDSPPLRPPT